MGILIERAMGIQVKICGLRRPRDVWAAAEGGAAMVGFVFYGPSPRALSPTGAGELAGHVPSGLKKVGVFVDASDDQILEASRSASLDFVQLHGREDPARVRAVAELTGLAIIKALPIAVRADLEPVREFEEVADYLLFDAKTPAGGNLPGGNAAAFDWGLLAGRSFKKPWLLSGGLTAENLGRALAMSGAGMVDVSSGVEGSRGEKSSDMIAAFLETAGGSKKGEPAKVGASDG